MQDICTALTFQGISYENVDRFRNNVRVEILDANHYENLISQGLNFFDAARFLAVPERWYRNSRSNSAANDAHDTDSVLQCYRCQVNNQYFHYNSFADLHRIKRLDKKA